MRSRLTDKSGNQYWKSERKHLARMRQILDDQYVKYVYIMSQDKWLLPDSFTLTLFKHNAGLFPKDIAKTWRYEKNSRLIPVNKEDHNKMIDDKISRLQARKIV